ncbi:MAG: hypothetical protein LQ340_007335 [Diploschistes diacapsis]|nr:MAG: hypothetical protein LQ340_007335 [Diploschistes diacapsis]
MRPRKKTRVESRAASTPSVATPVAEEFSDVPESVAASVPPELDPELWTDEQEIALFKGMIKWKPVGMHKHYRMISLSQHLRSHGHREQHTRPQGIWTKLGSLYNLRTLDEREDAFNEISSDDLDALTERFCEYRLPREDFGDMMFERRLEERKSSSPGMISGTAEGRASTVEDTEEPRSSPASSVRRRYFRRGRGARGRSKLQTESTPRGRAKASPEPSADEKEEEDEDKDSEEEEDEDNDEDDDDEEEEEEEEEDAPTPRGTRGRGRGRGRGARGGRRGKRRG